MSAPSAKRTGNRRRTSSVTAALNQVPLNEVKGGENAAQSTPPPGTSGIGSEIRPLDGPSVRGRKRSSSLGAEYQSGGFWKDVTSTRWMLVPASAFKLMLIMIALYWNHEALKAFGILGKDTPNPFRYFLYLQGKQSSGKYKKYWADIAFVFWHTVWWSFIRQAITIHILRPLAKRLRVKKSKWMRFTEQGYTVFYMGVLSTCGIYVMSGLPTWWYRTEHFWIDYPHREMTFELKLYYLMQLSYWLQQTIILAMKVEKPRKDFKELVAHHCVTLWLIGWSYTLSLTYIGVAIFVTMDVSDVFLAYAKCYNYVDDQSTMPFAIFIVVWTYGRHYLNLKILWSVWSEFKLIPQHVRVFNPWNDQWMPDWMQWQIFTPIALLQCINLFWWYLALRIMVRALLKQDIKDDRSDDEDEEPEMTTKQKVKTLKGDKAQ